MKRSILAYRLFFLYFAVLGFTHCTFSPSTQPQKNTVSKTKESDKPNPTKASKPTCKPCPFQGLCEAWCQCEANEGKACSTLEKALQLNGGPQRAANTKLLKQSCTHDNDLSCAFYGTTIVNEIYISKNEVIVTENSPLPPYHLQTFPKTDREFEQKEKELAVLLKQLERGCSNDLGWACQVRARTLIEGPFTPQNPPKDRTSIGVDMAKKACLLKLGQGCVSLALLQESILGQNNQQMAIEAEKTLIYACNTLQYATGCQELSRYYLRKNQVQKSVRILEQSCNQLKHGPSCNALGEFYHDGLPGLPRDLKKSISLFQLACDTYKTPRACGHLSQLYFSGTGVSQDKKQALRYAKPTCERVGGQRACSILGALYLEKSQKDASYTSQAKKAWNRGCLHLDGPSCLNLGKYYLNQSPSKNELGFLYIKHACVPWYSEGCYELGLLYKEGKIVTQNCEDATQAFKRSCEIDANSKGCAETCTSKVPPRQIGESCKPKRDNESNLPCAKGLFCQHYGTEKICTFWCMKDKDCHQKGGPQLICDGNMCRKKGTKPSGEICDQNNQCNANTTCMLPKRDEQVAFCTDFGSKTLGETCKAPLDCQKGNFCFSLSEEETPLSQPFCTRYCKRDQDCQNRERPMKCRYLGPLEEIPKEQRNEAPFFVFKMCVASCQSDKDCLSFLQCIDNTCTIPKSKP